MSEKSILEQALLQVETLEEAVKQNAKGILASTMKQELNDLLKESLEEEEAPSDEEVDPKEKEEDVPASDDEVSEQDDENDDESEEPSDEPDEKDDEGDELGDDNLPSLDEPNKDIDKIDSAGDDLGGPMSDEVESDDDVLDMTGASDEEVLKVFKAMGQEDGIIVKKDGDNIELEDGEDEYIIKLNEEEEEDTPVAVEESDETEVSEDWNEEENVYEIELGEDDEILVGPSKKGDVAEDDEDGKEVEATEAARTKWNPHGNKNGMKRSGLPSKKVFKAGSGLNEEVDNLRKQNAEYKKALVLFKDKLNEVAVFNANLAYATRLFTEHTTTKTEKMEILKRFDTISSITESKNLYNQIKTELETKKPVTETVVEKIVSTPSSSSTEVLSENKVYEAPQFRRMKDLMTKIK